MPTKPDKKIIEACNKHLDPKQIVLTIINEDPQLRKEALDAKIVREVKPTDQ